VMNSKLVVHPLHIAALLLHPLFRTLSSLYQDEQEGERAKSEGLEILMAAMSQTKAAQSAAASRIARSGSLTGVEILSLVAFDDSLFPWRTCLKNLSCIRSARLRMSCSGILVQRYLILTELSYNQTTSLG
jgi:hypothetical protein